MSTEPHILIVEDDREIRALMARLLKGNEFRVSTASDGREMDRILADSRIDLVILDVMLPQEDGLSICRRLRAQRQIPIIMVSAKGEEVDRVIGLEIGADDYLVKPFAARELLARVRAVMRRTSGPAETMPADAAHIFRFHGWSLDALRRTLTDPAGARVSVTDGEFDLLRVLCQRPGRVLSRDQLIDLTQGRAAGPNERSIDILVVRLRRKIEADPQRPDFIKTVRSGGYMFTPDVEAS
ncbi:response regulator [Phreatobacter oligotrophus]|uniref:response regulator n=1 Tax=Phreatobacter oligotrophus TaxID=1122261 RepID=UPI0023552AFE|nr:response regulator [Phreatobacter oligotrophus]MBX9989673.1 response regulator [Phreatobacter oligotrophus]